MERHFLADIGIEASGVTLTSSTQGSCRHVQSRIRVSAYHLAAWFVTNWWRLRREPEGAGHSWKMSHCMGAVGNGYLWPDIEISGGEDTVRIHATPILAEPTSRFRFLYGLDQSVPAADFEDAVQGLVASVTKRLSSPILDCPDDVRELPAAWDDLQRESQDQGAAFLRSLEARMGFGHEEADGYILSALEALTRYVGNGAIEEVATASKHAAIWDLETLLETIHTSGTLLTLGPPVSLSETAEDSNRTSSEPWELGVKLARAARHKWQVGDDELADGQFAEICGVQRDWIREGADAAGPMPAGIRHTSRIDALNVSLQKRHPNARRFALARIIGDHIMAASSERLLPITNSRTQRQRFQRAFATEFLCPIESLKEFVQNRGPDDDLLDDASIRYQVSPMLIERSLIKNGLWPRSCWTG